MLKLTAVVLLVTALFCHSYGFPQVPVNGNGETDGFAAVGGLPDADSIVDGQPDALREFQDVASNIGGMDGIKSVPETFVDQFDDADVVNTSGFDSIMQTFPGFNPF